MLHPDLVRKQRWQIFISVLVTAVVIGVLLFMARHLTPQPYTTRNYSAGAAVENKLYVFGGICLPNQNITNEILEIDPARRTIRVVAHLPFPRYSLHAVALGSQIYALGGRGSEGYCDEIVTFDPRSRNVQVAARLPSPRGFGAAAAVLGELYYIGGWDGDRCLDEIVKNDPSTGKVEIVAHLPAPIEHLAVTAYEDLLIIVGGEDETGTFVDEILIFDPKTREVTAAGPFPFPRIRATVTTVGDDIFLFGGWNLGFRNEIIRINVTDEGVTAKIVGRLPSAMADRAAVTANGKMYLLGETSSYSKRQLAILELDPVAKRVTELKF